MPTGQGRRCFGFTSGDFTRCTRPELAGSLDLEDATDAYVHWLAGPCRCVCDCHAMQRRCTCPVTHGPDTGKAATRATREPACQHKRDERMRALADRMFACSLPAPDTVVEDYLDIRGIAWRPGDPVRYAPGLLDTDTGKRHPGMVAEVVDRYGRRLGVHRTFLLPDGSDKAHIRNPKRSLGPIAGGAVRLAPAGPHIIVAEGIEDALGASQLTRYRVPAWAAVSTSGLRSLELPDVVQRVTIASDRDPDGRAAAIAAAERWTAEGRIVEVRLPKKPHKDYAEMALAEMIASGA
jgi:hypothetical protein